MGARTGQPSCDCFEHDEYLFGFLRDSHVDQGSPVQLRGLSTQSKLPFTTKQLLRSNSIHQLNTTEENRRLDPRLMHKSTDPANRFNLHPRAPHANYRRVSACRCSKLQHAPTLWQRPTIGNGPLHLAFLRDSHVDQGSWGPLNSSKLPFTTKPPSFQFDMLNTTEDIAKLEDHLHCQHHATAKWTSSTSLDK